MKMETASGVFRAPCIEIGDLSENVSGAPE